MKTKVALVGDYDASVTAHQAIPLAIKMSAQDLGMNVETTWLGTDTINNKNQFQEFQAIWCVPASPYRNMDGALLAIQYARQNKLPFLGTCGGFQHAVIEYARNVLVWHNADHAETSDAGRRLVITELSCSLVEVRAAIHFICGSTLANIYNANQTEEEYRCRFGLSKEIQTAFLEKDFRIAAIDRNGDVRAIEHESHPFFIATLFQPERAALKGSTPPLVKAFLKAAK